jgi:imidazolonepropionase-like amidohydrolase
MASMALALLLSGAAPSLSGAAHVPAIKEAPTAESPAVVQAAVAETELPCYAICCSKIVTSAEDGKIINDGVILLKGGKIEALGSAKELEIPEGYEVVEADDLWAVPGMVEAHNHIAGSLWDLNDGVFLNNPGLRTLDTIEPENPLVKNALAGGVTSALLIPGSGNNMSGFGTLVKLAGSTLDEALIRYPGSLKIAQAGNPEWYFGGVRRSMMNWNTRQTLLRARAYHESWEAFEQSSGPKPKFDPAFEDFRGLFRRQFPNSVHTQIYQVVLKTIEILNDELGLWTVLDHSTFDGFLLGEKTRERGMYVMNGPRQLHFERRERKIYGNASEWWRRGEGQQKLGVNTDSPVIPQEELSYQCAMAVHFGMPQEHGIAAVTRLPAQALGIFDRVGSLEVGKDADVCLWTGDPIDPSSACLKVWVNGKLAYCAKTMGRRF